MNSQEGQLLCRYSLAIHSKKFPCRVSVDPLRLRLSRQRLNLSQSATGSLSPSADEQPGGGPMAHTAQTTTTPKSGKLSYEDYVKERDSLVKFEQATYDGYEKTILTLSASFLAFSVSFLGLLQKGAKVSSTVLISPKILFWSWIFFGSGVFIMLCNFLVNAVSLRAAVRDVWNAYETQPTQLAKKWTSLSFTLYFLSGLSFVMGVIALIRFCVLNL
jgi:hypothetical protein